MNTKKIRPPSDMLEILTKPLTKKECKQIVGRLDVNIVVDLYALIGCGDVDGLNVIAEDIICKQNAILGEIEYKIVGCIPATKKSSGQVILNVIAGVWEPL